MSWNNSKGFGFIKPDGGGDNVFVHRTAFSNRQRIPLVDDAVHFSIVTDKQGRYCAGDVTFFTEKKLKKLKKRGSHLSSFSVNLAVVFLVTLVVTQLLGYVPKNLVLLYVMLSAVTFVLYAIDKSRAKKGAWRTQESSLHLLAIAGGWPGAAIAQQTLRHKSKKKEFRIVFWLTVFINFAGLVWLLSSAGASYLGVFK